MKNDWNATHYDSKLKFVSEFGKGVVSLLQPKQGEHILDLGCGTGDLSFEISKYGASVVGIDLSESMIQQAKKKYPDLCFSVENGEAFRTNEPFDAVFSNAALHWMKNSSKVVNCVSKALLSGGRFVAEFGGKGNVETVIHALELSLAELGISSRDKNPWYFPSIGEYTTLLEEQGFRTVYAAHFDRPSKMVDREKGLEHWLNGFAESYFQGLDTTSRKNVIRRVAELTQSELYHDGQWFIDYKRLQIVAIKR